MWRRDNLGRGCNPQDDGEGITQGSALALSSLLSPPTKGATSIKALTSSEGKAHPQGQTPKLISRPQIPPQGGHPGLPVTSKSTWQSIIFKELFRFC